MRHSKNSGFADKLKTKRLLYIFGVTALLILALTSNGFAATTTQASSSTHSGNHKKHLQPIGHHKIKALCGNPQPGYASCNLEATVNNNDQLINDSSPGPVGGYGPREFHTAYNLPCTPGGVVQTICNTPNTFGPETIAIVDAGNFASGATGILNSLQVYDQNYGLPSCTYINGCLTVMSQTGSTTSLPAESNNIWSEEIGLDVETAHMICQTCAIKLVESTTNSDTNLAAANVEAESLNPVVISNSWSSKSDAYPYDSDFEHPGIAIVAAIGDSGKTNGVSWPGDIPDVIAAAGTSLTLNSDDTWANETVWSDTGGGCAVNYAAPSWQTSLSDWPQQGCGTKRAQGDISADGDPNTGASVYLDNTSSWYEFGGTSLSTPLLSGMFALVGGMPSNAFASQMLYASYGTNNLHDITTGNDCTTSPQSNCTAAVGYDTPSGIGSPTGLGAFISLPTVPNNLTATFASQSSVSLNWSASSAYDGIGGYNIYRNGVKVGTATTGTSYTDTGLAANTNYSYYITAYDTNNDVSSPSSTVTGTTYLPEDINKDGHVDLLDLSLLSNEYGQQGANLGRSDINSDSTVNLLDLSLLASKYGTE